MATYVKIYGYLKMFLFNTRIYQACWHLYIILLLKIYIYISYLYMCEDIYILYIDLYMISMSQFYFNCESWLYLDKNVLLQ